VAAAFGNAAATQRECGEIIIDSGATITALRSTSQLTTPLKSKRKIFGFADGDPVGNVSEGTAHMWLFDHESGDGAGVSLPAVALESLRQEILSLSQAVKVLGFDCDLRHEGWEGLYKLDSQNRKVNCIPFIYDAVQRMWIVRFTTGKSVDHAKERASTEQHWESLNIATGESATGESETIMLAKEFIRVESDESDASKKIHLDPEDTTITLTTRRRERILTQAQRHRKLLHLGPPGKGCVCLICKQVRGKHRQVYKDGRDNSRPYRNPVPVYDEFAGHSIHADSAYWDVESIEGSWYTVNAIDDCTGWMGGFHTATRAEVTNELFRWIIERRTNPEFNNPNFCRKIYLDPAGEWHPKNVRFMSLATEHGVRVIPMHGKDDKRLNNRAEMGVKKLKDQVQAGLLDRRLDASWWQRLAEYAWHTRGMYPVRRRAASGLTPIEEISDGNISRAEVERRIEYATPPGTLCYVHMPGKHTGAMDVANSRFGIVRRMEGDTAVFESPETGHNEFYSKNFWPLDLRPGLSAHAYMRLPADPNKKPRAALPKDGRPRAEQYNIISLAGIVHGANGDQAVLQEITGPGDVLPACVTYDALGRILAPDANFELKPTGGIVHIIESHNVSDADTARQRTLLMNFRSSQPRWLIGAEVHKRFTEWQGVARGYITGFDEEYDKAWTVTYEADGVKEEYDSDDVRKYAIDCINGKSEADGGQRLYERYKLGDRAEVDLPVDDPSAWGDGDVTINPQDNWIPSGFKCYVTRDRDKWSDVCNGAGIKSSDRREYFIWLRQFKIGNMKEFRVADSAEKGYVFFPGPFGKTKSNKTMFNAGVKFPIPTGVLRDDTQARVRLLDARNEVDAENAMTEYVLNMVYNAKGSATAPGVPPIDPRETVDSNGIPLPPKTMVELEKREFKEMWDKAWRKEWDGLNHHDCFLHGLLIEELVSMGVMGGRDGKKIVNTQMLFESKLLDGLFNKYKARCVANGHPGAVRKGIDYQTVFAAAPHLQSQRIMRAVEVLLGWTPVDFDVKQAYLLGKADLDQRYPIRYPAGPIRELYRGKDGKERYGLIVGNLYGLPSSGRVYAKERNRLVLEELPKRTGWKTRKLTSEPCMYEIITGNGKAYMLVHTDDCDLVVQCAADKEKLVKEFNALFGIKGADGVDIGDGKNMLGIHRERWSDKGVRFLRLTQAGNIEGVWQQFGDERKATRKRPPSTPFPTMDEDHPRLDNNNKVVDVTPEESTAVHAKGYRNIVGSILWPTRCTAPELGYAASILSKCMASPPETAWRAALHVAHWMHTHKSEGITFSSHGNLEPVCYYDSGYKQKHLFDKPQYGYVIFWGGAPIIWQSKRHTQVPQSVSQAEFETLTHAWRDVKWLREFIKEMGLGKYVERPTPMIGDNRNARDWALEDVMADGNRHFEHKYFTIRERIEKGEIIPYWISGKENPSDLLTKATDKGAVDALLPYMHGTKEIPIPEGLQVWFGPIESPELRGNPKQS